MRPLNRRPLLLALIPCLFAGHRAAAQRSAPPPIDSRAPGPDTIGTRSTALATSEIAGFLVALNLYDRVAYRNQLQDGKKVYSSTVASTWDHLWDQTWVHDQDPFNTNQFAHPYQGATMFGIARSSGHGFWRSAIFSNAGSFAWKMAGETDPPSSNDMITTGQAGSLLGEALYRIADIVLKDGGENPPWWHAYLAAVISPPTGVNRRVLGDRFRDELPDSTPAVAWQVGFGATADAIARDYTAPGSLLRGDGTSEFSVAYGLPGRPGYDYSRPLDYFDLQLSLLSRSANPIENVMLRGLLLGRRTAGSATSRGIWGLYGSYDYVSPYLFRVSSTALSLGTTRQYWLAPAVALQGSVLGGVGYGAAGSTTVVPSTPTNAEIRDYHFGVTPQALLALRLITGDRAMLDMTAREYYVSGLGSDDARGSEKIFRANVGASVRIVGGHALGLRYVESTRNAKYGSLPGKRLSEGTVTVVYSFLGANHFGAVKY
jgi:hypothetical protein